jgi:hypothetical protein
MDITNLILQGGALAVLCLISVYLVYRTTKRDDEITEERKEYIQAVASFTLVMTNHLQHEEAEHKAEKEALRDVCKALNRLCGMWGNGGISDEY